MIKPTNDGIALFSSSHSGEMKELLLEERTIGELVVARKKPTLLFKLFNFISNGKQRTN